MDIVEETKMALAGCDPEGREDRINDLDWLFEGRFTIFPKIWMTMRIVRVKKIML